jgi:hypothetical protein
MLLIASETRPSSTAEVDPLSGVSETISMPLINGSLCQDSEGYFGYQELDMCVVLLRSSHRAFREAADMLVVAQRDSRGDGLSRDSGRFDDFCDHGVHHCSECETTWRQAQANPCVLTVHQATVISQTGGSCECNLKNRLACDDIPEYASCKEGTYGNTGKSLSNDLI